MDKQQAIDTLNDTVLYDDTITYQTIGTPETLPDMAGWKHTYVVTVGDNNISHALVDAVQGILVNGIADVQVQCATTDDGTPCLTAHTDARTLTIMMGEAIGREAHKNFNFHIV